MGKKKKGLRFGTASAELNSLLPNGNVESLEIIRNWMEKNWVGVVLGALEGLAENVSGDKEIVGSEVGSEVDFPRYNIGDRLRVIGDADSFYLGEVGDVIDVHALGYYWLRLLRDGSCVWIKASRLERLYKYSVGDGVKMKVESTGNDLGDYVYGRVVRIDHNPNTVYPYFVGFESIHPKWVSEKDIDLCEDKTLLPKKCFDGFSDIYFD